MVGAEVSARLGEAMRLRQSGALAEAEGICRRVLAADAGIPDAWNLLAQILHQRGDLDAAALAAERATSLRPQIPPYWLTRGGIAQAQRRVHDAQTCFRRAIELDAGFAEAHFRLGLS